MNISDKINVKMILLDLDGTLLHSDKSVSDYTISTLEKCKQKGIIIVIATARSEMAAKHYLKHVKPDVVISNGGSLVRYGEKIIHKSMLPAKVSDEITAELISKIEFISVSVETETGYYVTWNEADSPDYAHAIHYDFQMPLSEDAYKIIVEMTSAKVVKELAEKYSECCMIPFSDGNYYRFANKRSGKMSAIKEIARFFSMDLSQIISFGDDYNDVEMIQNCGVGVSMGNAVDEVKAVANYICDTNDNDGVAKWVDMYIL